MFFCNFFVSLTKKHKFLELTLVTVHIQFYRRSLMPVSLGQRHYVGQILTVMGRQTERSWETPTVSGPWGRPQPGWPLDTLESVNPLGLLVARMRFIIVAAKDRVVLTDK